MDLLSDASASEGFGFCSLACRTPERSSFSESLVSSCGTPFTEHLPNPNAKQETQSERRPGGICQESFRVWEQERESEISGIKVRRTASLPNQEAKQTTTVTYSKEGKMLGKVTKHYTHCFLFS